MIVMFMRPYISNNWRIILECTKWYFQSMKSDTQPQICTSFLQPCSQKQDKVDWIEDITVCSSIRLMCMEELYMVSVMSIYCMTLHFFK